MIRPFLKDAKTSVMFEPDEKDTPGGAPSRETKFFPVRQAAYSALRLLGEHVDYPEGYYAKDTGWLFKIGFESRNYFPPGHWQVGD